MITERRILEMSLVLMALVLIVGEKSIQSLVPHLAAQHSTTTESIVLKKEYLLNQDAPPADVLFLGDSTTNAAIDDDLYNQLQGHKRALNLGLVGDLTAFGDYWALKKYLSRWPAPKAIVFWHTVDVWPRNLNLSLFYFTRPSWQEQREALKNSVLNIHYNLALIQWPVKVLSQILEGQVYQLSNIYRYRIGIKKMLAEHVPALDPLGLVEKAPKPIAPTEHRVLAQSKAFGSLSLYISKDNHYWFERLLELAESSGIRLYAGRTPLNEEFVADKAVDQKVSQLDADLTGFFKKYPQVTQLTQKSIVLPADCFNDDKDHVNSHGKEVLTRRYASLLASFLNK